MRVVCDFETMSFADLETVGAWAYSEHITTEVLCFVFSIHGTPYAWLPEHREHEPLLRELVADPEVIFVRHGDFEAAIWRNQMMPVHGFPDIPNERWDDTMAKSAVKALPLSLEGVLEVLDLGRKDKEGSKLTVSLSRLNKKTGMVQQLWTPETKARVVEYCTTDVDQEYAVDNRLGPMPPGEREAFDLHQLMTQRGLRIDLQYIERCQAIVDGATVPLLAEFRGLTGINPTQGKELHKWMGVRGVTMPNLQKETVADALGENIDAETEDGQEVEATYLSDSGVLPPEVRRALQIRQLIGSSSVKKLGSMAACVCADGRARGLSQYHGAGPGRSTGRLFNAYNFPRGTITVQTGWKDGKPVFEPPSVDLMVPTLMTGDWEYVETILGPPIEAVVSGLRHAIISDRGKSFLSGDLAGIQARVVLALAGQDDKTALMASGADVYCDMAGQIYKREITKKDKVERHVGKCAVLGLGFQLGSKGFRQTFCKKHPLEFAEKVVNVYRREWAPRVPELWRGLSVASLRAVFDRTPQEAYGIEYRLEDGWLSARLPSGRKLWYWNPQKVRRAMPWDETDIRMAWTFQRQKQGRWVTETAFGGQLTENVVMGIEVDIQRAGWKNCEANGFPIVHECYDELVAEVPEWDEDLDGFRECLLDLPQWVRDYNIPVNVPREDMWASDRYRK